MSFLSLAQAEQLKDALMLAYREKQGICIRESSIWTLCLSLLNRNPSFFLASRWDNDKLMGFLIAQKTQNLLSDEILVQELCLFVLPEYRGRGLTQSLINEGLAWAKSIQAKMIYTITDDTTKALAERLGFKAYGYCYYKEG